jgi:hypothetical protein
MSSDVLRNWDKILHKNVRSKDMDGVGNVVAINDDSISITTQGSQHINKIPKSHIGGYNGAGVFLDLSAADMSTYDIDSKSQALKEETTTTAKSTSEVSTSTPTTAQTQTTSITEKRTRSTTTDLASSHTPVIIDNKNSSLPNEALGTKREDEDKARREAEAIEQTAIKESIEPQQRQQTIRQEKNLVTSRENADYLRNDCEPFSANMTLAILYASLIDMHKEFAINAAKLSEYWFNLFWSPWTKEQREDKIKVE